VGDSAPAEDNMWSTTVPKATNAGDYKVWYRAHGNAGFANSDAGYVNVTVAKQQCTITFESETVYKTVGDEAFTNALTNTGLGTVTYSTNANASHASINTATGQVTILATTNDALGNQTQTYTVTATVADTDNQEYAVKTKTYTLIILENVEAEGTGAPATWGNGGEVTTEADRNGI